MANIGYARVSSKSQDITLQLEKLKFCDKIFKDKLSGLDAHRPGLSACLEYIRDGDTLVITKLDRLARSTFHLCQIVELLKNKGVMFKVLDQNIDTSTSTGKLLFNILASIAEFETEIRRERQAEGIEKAKLNGVKWGPSQKLTDDQVIELKTKKDNGEPCSSLAKHYNVSYKTVYNYLNRLKQANIQLDQ